MKLDTFALFLRLAGLRCGCELRADDLLFLGELGHLERLLGAGLFVQGG